MKIKILPSLYYLNLSLAILVVLFRIQHWPGHTAGSLASAALTGVLCLMIILELVNSKLAASWKMLYVALAVIIGILPWIFSGLIMLFVFFFAGRYYLATIRPTLFIKENFIKNNFDSI